MEIKVAPAELEALSLLVLSGRVTLTADESMSRAFVALACRDDKAFFNSIERAYAEAAAESPLRASIDSVLSFQRGLDHVPTRGFLRVGDRWLTWEEKANEALEKEVVAAIATVLAQKGDATQAHARLLELAGQAPAQVLEQLRRQRDSLAKAFAAAPETERLAKLRQRAVELFDARKFALALIFDEAKYFYPYSPPACPPDKAALYPEVQQEVDRRVVAVRQIWGREESEAPELHVTLSAALLEDVRQLKAVRKLLDELGVRRDEGDQRLSAAWCLPESTRTVNLRNFALDEYERARLDQDAKINLLNQSVLPHDGGANREEIEQVSCTNRYRAMLGRRVLAYNEKLRNAARAHSDWMSRKGELSHFEDDPARASPEQRMKLEGYTSGAGENCAVGSSGPREVLDGWCHSSGHHRNLLYESHTELGSGLSGSYWTQNFGGGREYKGNLIKD